MKVKIDPDICIGCTLCVQTCPDVYKMEGEKAVVYVAAVPKAVEAACKQAADECPVTAIIITE
ncbi:MAG: ferredoxin [Candidatus Omnitrophota bacterium]